MDYLESLDFDAITAHEADLLAYTTEAMQQIPGIRPIGTAAHKAAVFSFVLECAHPHDIGTIIDSRGVAIRAGHHCAQPLMERFGVAATARASFGMYNKKEDIDVLVDALLYAKEIFS